METLQIEQRLHFYISMFQRLKGIVGDGQLAIAILQEVGKDGRTERMQTHESDGKPAMKNGNGNGNGSGAAMEDMPATEKQLGFLKTLGVSAKPGLTKKEASTLIDEKTQKA